MKKKSGQFRLTVGISMVLAILVALLAPYQAQLVLANPDTVIDTFDDPQVLTQTGVGTTTGTAGSTMIGGERDVIATVTGGTLSLRINIDDSGNSYYAHSQDSQVYATSEIQWDGSADATKSDVDYDGLGSNDLTVGGDNAFVIELISADLNTAATITFWDYTANAAGTCSTLTKQLPGHPSAAAKRVVVFPFNQFGTGGSCTTAASLTDVGAVTLKIDGTGQDSADVTIDLFKTDQLDYGDLINFYNNTTLSDDGAGHVIGSIRFGTDIDTETDGQESPFGSANQDDNNGTDDEDGVVATGLWSQGDPPGNGGSVDVSVAGGSGCVMGWIDWDFDASFGGTDETVINNQLQATGLTSYQFRIPVDPRNSCYYARFRLFPEDAGGGCTTAKPIDGQYPDGEVEDYYLCFGPNAITLSGLNAQASPTVPIVVGLGLVGLLAVGALVVVRRRA